MAIFDLETFFRVQGLGENPFEALGTAFGVPNCLINLTKDALSILPSDILVDISKEVEEGKKAANNVVQEVVRGLLFEQGIIEFDTETGRLKFKSDSSKGKLDNDSLQVLKNLQGVLGGFAYAASFGAQLYTNYQTISSQINEISECLNTFEKLQKFQKGASASQKSTLTPAELDAMMDKEYGLAKQRVDAAKAFVNQCDRFLSDVGDLIQERIEDPSKEPQFSDSAEFDQFLRNTNYARSPINDTPDTSGGTGTEEGIFRLSFGPPVSTRGYFLMTKDGLYYDSQTGGLDPIFVNINSKVIPDGEKWKYEFDPNLGGKGDAVSLDVFNKYKNTLFDPDIIDDSPALQEYYINDHFLRNLTEQRDKHINDLSATLTTQLAGGESSITKNLRLAIASEMATHGSKIRRRKKQIEIAVKAPNVFTQTKGEPIIFKSGEIPINDFSYLNNYNFSVEFEKQNALFFKQGELDGIVLPIETKYASPPVRETESLTIKELIVPEIGIGDIIYSEPTTSATVLSLTDTVVTSGLFAIYNFLQPDVVQPSSTEYRITNTITNNQYNNLQLVANYASSVFVSGLSIPYLEGIVKNKSTNPALASALGSYARLPDTVEFQELLYNPSGFTIECWVHAPFLTNGSNGWLSGTTSSLSRVILANENVGAKPNTSALNATGGLQDLDFLGYDNGDSFVKGFVMGFTRDRRITQENTGYSNDNANNPATTVSFFIAPTQSRDFSSCSWVNKANCGETESFYKMQVDSATTINGKNFRYARAGFILVDVIGDPQKDELRMYCDGQLMATSSISAVFGVRPYATIDLPSFKKDNSFEYSRTSVDGPISVKNGPKLNKFYTPWIVGGGYTDGMYQYGNFMGGDRGGVVSGLRGFIGSLKFYNRPLDSDEVLQNYTAQQIYFKNIKT